MRGTELLALAAGALGTIYAWPQVRRIRTLGHTAGVSVSTWLLTYIVVVAWCGWAVSVASPAAVVTNGIASVLAAAVVMVLVPKSSRPLLWLPALAALLIGLVLIVPPEVTNAALVALTCSRIPQVRQSWRSRKAGTASAVSMHSLGLGLLSGSLWCLWGVLAGHHLVIFTSVITTGLMLLIAVLEWPTSRARSSG